MKDILEGFATVAIASVADAVDKVCGRRGYMDSTIKPRINEQRVADRRRRCSRRRPTNSCRRSTRST